MTAEEKARELYSCPYGNMSCEFCSRPCPGHFFTHGAEWQSEQARVQSGAQMRTASEADQPGWRPISELAEEHNGYTIIVVADTGEVSTCIVDVEPDGTLSLYPDNMTDEYGALTHFLILPEKPLK